MMTIKYNVVHGGYPRMYSLHKIDCLDNYNNIQVRYANICIEEVKADRIMEVGGLTYYYKGGYCQGTIETSKIISITNHCIGKQHNIQSIRFDDITNGCR